MVITLTKGTATIMRHRVDALACIADGYEAVVNDELKAIPFTARELEHIEGLKALSKKK